jgi:hypothetical protein
MMTAISAVFVIPIGAGEFPFHAVKKLLRQRSSARWTLLKNYDIR